MCAMIEKLRMRSGGVLPAGLAGAGTGCFLRRTLPRTVGAPFSHDRTGGFAELLREPRAGGCEDGAMTSTSGVPGDPRAVLDYRIPATELRGGDLINTSPGADEDWQLVLSVHTRENPDPGPSPEAAGLVATVGDRYVVVRMTDVAPVDSPVYFAGGVALVYGLD